MKSVTSTIVTLFSRSGSGSSHLGNLKYKEGMLGDSEHTKSCMWTVFH